MTPIRIFIGGAQREFARERAQLRDYLHGDPLMRRFFEVLVPEPDPARDGLPNVARRDAVEHCDIYVGLFGADYGDEGEGRHLGRRARVRPGRRASASTG